MSDTIVPETQNELPPETDASGVATLELPSESVLDQTDADTSSDRPLTIAEERQLIIDFHDPSNLRWNNLDWITLGWTVVMHVGAVAALFNFTWPAFFAFLVLHWLTASIGICLGYHRYLSHRSFKLRTPGKFFAMLCGTLSAEGSPLDWASTHRLHHQKSDQKGDPHSPNQGNWWSHILWLFAKPPKGHWERMHRIYTPELVNDPILRFFQKTEFFLLVGSGVVLYLIGGLPMLLWGLCMRMVVAYHSTWFVNSATHIWGYRNYETRDRSRNLWWVALLSYGEGWHNNHHAHPSVAPAGHRWWEIDMTWMAIRTWQFFGLAYDVKDQIPDRASRKAGIDENDAPADPIAATSV
ncbi:acyl-CoA desaturase [Thalassoroseus pseudoceratinae]|uniref:acyl-CoA desaturase n=1 Tax=Thalassoroseus pseudoceratinae TaxID=2713176 RepID=UPI001420AC50|nr:fatty acid desaturase [Thalassoroseus pseudoceratinae]